MIKVMIFIVFLNGWIFAQVPAFSSFDDLKFSISDLAIESSLKRYHNDLVDLTKAHVVFGIQWQPQWVESRKFWVGLNASVPKVHFLKDDLWHDVVVVEAWFGSLFKLGRFSPNLSIGMGISGQWTELIPTSKDSKGLHLLESGESEFGVLYGIQYSLLNIPLAFQIHQKVHFTNPNFTLGSQLSLLYFWRSWNE